MFSATLIRRVADKAATATTPPPPPLPFAPKLRTTGIYDARYQPRKTWPPDFSRLSDKEKFRYERKYKRRLRLATARPRWDRYVRLAQLCSVTFVLVYSVLFMDWKTDRQPFEGIRSQFWGALDAFSPAKRHDRPRSDTATISDQKP